MSAIYRCLFTVVAALALATPASAQWKPVADASQVRMFSPTLATTSASEVDILTGFDRSAPVAAEPTFTAPPFPGATRQSQDVALMIVGGTALIIGSVIGDDAGTLMMVGGGVLGLLGLYRYLT